MECRIMLQLMVFAVAFAVGFTQYSPGDEQCQSLVNVSSCQPWGNCSGLLCPKASFVVFKCQDPVVVQLTLPNIIVMNFTVTNSIQIVPFPNDNALIVSAQRDDINLYFNATYDNALIIPDVVVPLNASDCMCRGVQELAGSVQAAALGLRCTAGTSPRCDRVQCLPQTLLLFGVDLTILPCRSPPGVQISLTDSSGYAIYGGVFDRSQNASVSVLLTLSVSIVQNPYSLDVEVNVSTPLYGTLSVFNKTTVILDKSSCNLPSPTPPYVSPTCQALQSLQSNLPACSLNQACSGLNCALLGFPYTVSFEVEPCTQPASILLTVRDSNGAVLYNSSINDTTTVPLGPGVSLYVVLRQLPNALGLKVDLLIPSGTINLVPFYTIPIDQSQCGFDPTSTPTSVVPQLPNECEDFMSIVATNPLCMTSPSCTDVKCPIFGYTVGFRVLPCNTPPAIFLTILDVNDTVVFAQVIDRTQQVPLVGGTTLLVTVAQLMDAVGVEIDFQSPLGTTNIVPYTVFRFNSTNCGPTQTTPSSSSPGTTCDALNRIAASQQSCSTNMACDEIDCSVQGYTTAVAVLPCNSPPAIRLTVADSNGTTLFSQTISRSRQVPLLGGTVTLQVIVDQLDGALGVQVGLSTLFGSGTIIPYTVIPINTSSCPQTQAPPTSPPEVATTCDALSSITSYNPSCLTNGACDMLTCTAFGLSTGFTVLPCNSPPAVVVSVRDSNGTSLFSQTLSQSQLVPLFGGALTLVVTVDQLNNSLGLKVDAVSAFGGSINLIPYTAIPLNTSNCGPTGATPSMTTQPTSTCAALTSISAAGQGCSVTPSCNEVDCSLLGYSTGFIVLPCNSPPAVGIIVNDTRNNTLFYQVISQSQQIPLFGLTSLDVTVVQLSNAIGLKVDVSPLPGTRVNVVPYTVIPLNTSNCGTTGAPPTSAPPTSTCGALNSIAASNQACSPTTDCQEVDCSYLNYTIGVAVVPCSTPPGVKLTVADPQGLPLYSQMLTQSQSVPVVVGILSFYVTVDQLGNALGVKVDVVSAFGSQTVVPYTVIPLNTSNCAITPTQAPPNPGTCRALRQIAATGQSCSATVACDGVDCQYINYRLSMRLLPCNTPPGVRVIVTDQITGRPLYNQTLSQSQQIPVALFTTFDVNVTQFTNAIGVKIDLNTFNTKVNIIPFTVIPLSATGCNASAITTPPGTPTVTTSQGTTTPSKGSSSTSSPSKGTLSPVTDPPSVANQAQENLTRQVSIGVPVSIGIVVILLIVSAIAFVAWRKHKVKTVKYSTVDEFSTNNDVYHLAANDDVHL